MKSQKYSKASVEVLDILKHTKKEDVEKVPKEFIDFLEENRLEEYESNLDHTKQIQEMDLGPETQNVLGYIYLKYWADQQAKESFRAKIRELEIAHQEELREKYNPDDIFKKREETTKKVEDTKLPEIIQKQTFIQKIINAIKRFFRR